MSGNEVADVLGYPLPARSLRSLNARPSRYSSHCPGLGKRLPRLSSHEVRLSFTAFPEVSAREPMVASTSPGVLRPYSAQGEGSPRPASFPAGIPVSRAMRRRVPSRRLRCRSQVFATSQRLAPPSAVLPFSGRWRSWGSALQGVNPPAQPRRLVTVGMPSRRSSRGSRLSPS